MTLLTIYTPTYKRPLALKVCVDSISNQTHPQLIEHVIIPDEIGIGIDGVYRDVPNHLDKVHGDYVLFLADDEALCDPNFARKLYDFVEDKEYPQVVIIKADKMGRVLPELWLQEPRMGYIDLSCFIVRSDVWKANADKWGQRYEGDFDFIHALWEQGYTFEWWNFLAVKSQRISRGQPE